jgi:hypothetical protein
MQKNETNRANQLAVEPQYVKGVKLIDIDTTISEYMVNTIVPDLEENSNKIKVPLIYGNAERWTNARKQGYLKDQRGKIQIPLIMFKRNSIERDSTMQHFKENLLMPSYQKYSKTNRYEKFSMQVGARPVYEIYNVRVPSYVTVTYEVMIWTSFTEHMNKIVEAFQYATDRYWGKDDGYKFRVRLESFDTQQEVGDGTERIIRTTFTMVANAYLLPETFDNAPLTKKSLTTKKVVFGVETGISGELFSNPLLYNEYAQVIDFIAVRGSQLAIFVNANTAKLSNVKLPKLPVELRGSFDISNWFQVYINSVFIPSSVYTYVYNGETKEIVFTFTGLAFSLDNNDEISITGKFIQL